MDRFAEEIRDLETRFREMTEQDTINPPQPQPHAVYGARIAANIRAERARNKIKQTEVVEHMRALGYNWHRQTLGKVEKAERQVLAVELFGLAEALHTTVHILLRDTR